MSEKKANEKKSLNQLLVEMSTLEDEFELNEGLHAELAELARNKPDSYKELLDKMDAQIELKEKWIEEQQKSVKVLKNKKLRWQNYLVFVLRNNAMTKLVGPLWTIHLCKQSRMKFIYKPTRADFVKHPDWIDVSYRYVKKEPEPEMVAKLQAAGVDTSDIIEFDYEWKKAPVKAILDSEDPSQVSEIAKMDETVFVQFKPTKGV